MMRRTGELVFSEPYEASNGTVIVTVSGGRGGSPVGVYTITADGTTWTPAVDAGRLALIGVCTGFVAALLGTVAVLRRPPWPELTERVMVALAEARISQLNR
jgi:hypothetical protein